MQRTTVWAIWAAVVLILGITVVVNVRMYHERIAAFEAGYEHAVLPGRSGDQLAWVKAD